MKINTVVEREDVYQVNGNTFVPKGDAEFLLKLQKWIDSGGVVTPYTAPAPTVLEQIVALEQSIDSSRIRIECLSAAIKTSAGQPLTADEQWALDKVNTVSAEIVRLRAQL